MTAKFVTNPHDALADYENIKNAEGDAIRKTFNYFGNPEVLTNYQQFLRLNHKDRMNYTGDGGAWHSDAEKFNKTDTHVAFVQQQIVRDRHTAPIFPKPKGMARSIRSSLNDIVTEAHDSEGPGGIGDEFKEIM